MSAVMLDLHGTELSAEERELLQHPSVGGVILFSRNYHEPQQLQALCAAIRAAARNPVVIAIDHEGGRVQRCRHGFSSIPAMASFEQAADSEAQGKQWARQMGWLMATEVLACGMDFSFAPVLDVQGCSEVIGDRAFSAQPKAIESYGGAFIDGMQHAGMSATGKHFPGHGSVQADSHVAIPIDEREPDAIAVLDLMPFKYLLDKLQAVMPAHVIYSQVDSLPAGFSRHWLQSVLRQQLQFDGVIFSDDLTMEGATVVGPMQERAERAFDAGCDMVLVCNDRAAAVEVLDNVKVPPPTRDYLGLMRAQKMPSWETLQASPSWQEGQRVIDLIRSRLGQ